MANKYQSPNAARRITDEYVLAYVGAELASGQCLDAIFARGLTLIDYCGAKPTLRYRVMKSSTFKRRFYAARERFDIGHLANHQYRFMGQEFVPASPFEPPITHPVGRPRKKISRAAI
jgi:hypothetical protein